MHHSGTEQFNAASASGTRPSPARPQDTSFKPRPPTICLHAYGTNKTADVPKPLARSPGRRDYLEKKGLGGWGCLRNKFLKKKETN
jgi:hypothetical protein